jgi:hypothetical protein
MQYSYNYFFKIKKKLLEKQKKGQHKGIRYITKIEKDNIDLAKIRRMKDRFGFNRYGL